MENESITKLSVLAHPRRLEVFRLLMRRYPDAVPAGVLAQVLDLPASSLSSALSHLRHAGLVTQERQGTSLLYAADVVGAEALVSYLVADCCRGRTSACFDLNSAQRRDAAHSPRAVSSPRNVLFVCTGNSARSIFAEALLTRAAPDRFSVFSAGTQPRSRPHPRAIAVLHQNGHDTDTLRAKHISEYQGDASPHMDVVVTVCDGAAHEDTSPWPGTPLSGHWGLPDPAKATGSDAAKQQAFQSAYEALEQRITAFAALPFDTLDRPALQTRIDAIARSARAQNTIRKHAMPHTKATL